MTQQQRTRELRISRKSVEVRQSGDNVMTLRGYAAVFYDPNKPGTEYGFGNGVVERIRPTAFAKSIQQRSDIIATFNHDPNNLLGRTSSGTLRLTIDNTGLLYEVDLPNTHYANELVTLVQRGDVWGSSFAFVVPDGGEQFERVQLDEGEKLIRWLVDVELLEVGPVAMPAYYATSVEQVARSYIQSRARSFFTIHTRAAVPHEKLPLYDGDTWDADTALSRIRQWAGGEDNIDWEKYRRAFAWYDAENSETFGAYKLPHHDVVDGELVTHRKGVIAAMQALLGARGGTDIPDADFDAVYKHLAEHYSEFDMEPPERAFVAKLRLASAHQLLAVAEAES
ncbi:MAG: HK97 family phage prohead protease [Candidatus Caldarchaeum sp.]